MVSRITRTSAHRALEHRLRDAVKWWETRVDEREGPAPVVGSTVKVKVKVKCIYMGTHQLFPAPVLAIRR